MTTPFCAAPFNRVFVLPNGTFRNCCQTSPSTVSDSNNWGEWWHHNDELNNFRQELISKQDFPTSCNNCKIQENVSGNSFRTALNQTYNAKSYPAEWSVMVGNICNLACWHCTEEFSSRIEADKRKLNILPKNYISPTLKFEQHWPELKTNILSGFDHHEYITLSLLGGEPTYNKVVKDFLFWLYDNNLSSRTRLEITTNGTNNNNLHSILKQEYWQYIYMAISIDAIGKKAEWLRYGCSWGDVDNSINFYKEYSNYVELHLTVSILNLKDLPAVYDYAHSKNIKLIISTLNYPDFLSIEHWDGPDLELDKQEFIKRGLDKYVDLLKLNPRRGNFELAKAYIQQLSANRKSLLDFDEDLYQILFK
jgi:MoaA/NifB/PqqE/SkfB family radical SAM enzyme